MSKAHTIELRYGLDSFRSDWRHCSLGSDFLAETAFNTARTKQIASTAINEVLELAFRLGAKGTKSWVQAMVKPGHDISLNLDILIGAENIAAVSDALTQFNEDALQYYQLQLGTAQPGLFFGVAYLATDFLAQVKLTLQENVLGVRCNVPLRDGVF